jgi:hypothetical protein
MDKVLYQDNAKYDLMFRVVQVLPLAIIVFAYFSEFKWGEQVKYIVMGVVFIIGVAFWLLMPRRFYIMEDRIKFMQGLGLSFSIRYRNIEAIGRNITTKFRLNLSTYRSEPVVLVRKKGMNVAFTPENEDEFIRKCSQAINTWKAGASQQ